MTTLSAEARQLRRQRWAWYMYDFGNSAYAAVVLLAVYSAYFKGSVVGGAEGSRLWGIAVGVAMLVVAMISPVLGAIADFSGSKKKILLAFTTAACVFTALLFFVESGDVVLNYVCGTPPQVPGDTDGDGDVDEFDAQTVAANWGSTTATGPEQGDFIGDGAVNATDASILAGNYGYGTSEALVPEPSAVVLLVMGLAMLAIRRRR